MAIDIAAFTSGDDVFVAWRVPAPIPDCMGFALSRKRGGHIETVANYVGFEQDGRTAPQPSTVWPIRRFRWVDHLVDAGDQVSYRVVARIRGADGSLVDGERSPWTDELEVSPGDRVKVFFNRGIVASQWVSAILHKEGGTDSLSKTLKKVIAEPGDPARNALAGYVRQQLLALLAEAHQAGSDVYAALYELNDPELIDALIALGPRAHVVLANGSKRRVAHSSPAQFTDPNKKVADQLQGKVDLHRRLVVDDHLSHHKFLVVVENGVPKRVWTGSTNWTMTGLCTQGNNALLLESKKAATAFREQWDRLVAAGNDYPQSLLTADDTPTTTTVGGAGVTIWFAPTSAGADLEAANEALRRAEQGVLFLMFNPGPKNTLLSTILELGQLKRDDGKVKLLIRGVINQDPGGNRAPVLRYGPGATKIPLDPSVLLPAAVEKDFEFWKKEQLGDGLVMVHSKVVVVDPFGPHPILMTGSHNMGPKASKSNDDNLVIIRDDPAAARAHACVIMAIYDAYHFRELQLKKPELPRADPQTWQDYPLAGGRRETDFWFG